jgi:hypothetical protein
MNFQTRNRGNCLLFARIYSFGMRLSLHAEVAIDYFEVRSAELHAMLDQLVAWGSALKELREQEAKETAMV